MFNTLTEFCQGPCTLNQNFVLGPNFMADINTVLAITRQDDEPDKQAELMRCQSAAIVTLLSLLEGGGPQASPCPCSIPTATAAAAAAAVICCCCILPYSLQLALTQEPVVPLVPLVPLVPQCP